MNQTSCRVCGRPLKNLQSIIAGIGPVCGGGNHYAPKKKRKGKDEGAELFDNHAEFSIQIDAPGYVYIIDTGHNHGKRTITNDAENVISELYGLIDDLKNKRVFYLDSDGRIDEIIHSAGRFVTFKAGHEGVAL